MINVRDEKGDITIGCIDIERIMGKYYEQLYGTKFGNVNEMSSLEDRQPKLSQKE